MAATLNMKLSQNLNWCEIALVVVIALFQISSAEIYYVKPTEETSFLQNDSIPCLTLSQYATKPDNYFTSNVTLLLLPGTHQLNHVLTITNIDYIGLQNSHSSTRIFCRESLTGFNFSIVELVNISGIESFNCSWNISSVQNFLLSNSTMRNEGFTGTMLIFNNVTANILNSYFISNNPPTQDNGIGQGGVLSVLQSSVTIRESEFVNNEAYQGGSVYAHQSRLSIFNSKFVNNSAHLGGVVNAIESTATIENCTFFNNTAEYGGVVFATSETDITISSCAFKNNFANLGGVAVLSQHTFLTVNKSTFKHNLATTSGGVIYGTNSNLHINQNMFISNQALNINTSGGIINASECTITISKSFFINTTAGQGGVIRATKNTTIDICHSHFTESRARRDYGGVLFINRSELIIYNSTFTNNTAKYDAGVVYVLRSSMVASENTFLWNSAPWGGVLRSAGGIVNIFNCNFTNNAALAKGNRNTGQVTIVGTNTTIQNSHFGYNKQGAVYCQQFANVHLTNITFAHNNGSALFIISCSLKTSGFINIQNNIGSGSVFLKGSNATIDGSMKFTNNNGSFATYSSSVILSENVTFTHNRPYIGQIYQNSDISPEGGALTAYQQSEIIFKGNCHIENNSATIGGGILVTETELQILKNLIIANNTAIVSGGGISAFQSEINIRGDLTVTENQVQEKGGGAFLAYTKLTLLSESSTNIANNNAYKGGAIYLDLNSKIYINKERIECINCTTYVNYDTHSNWISFNLSHNSAKYQGGAIYHNDYTNTDLCNPEQRFSSTKLGECFIQSLALYSVPADPNWNESALYVNNIHFINNTAQMGGSALYGGLLDRCTLSSQLELRNKYTTLIGDPVTYLLNITDIDLQEVSSDAVSVVFCVDGQRVLNNHKQTIDALQGENVSVSVVAVDQEAEPVPAIVHSSLSLSSAGLGEGQVRQNITQECTNLTYAIYSSLATQVSLTLYPEGPCNDQGPSVRVVNLTLFPCSCPPGLQPSPNPSTCICQCDLRIEPFVTNCSGRTGTVVRNTNTWIDYVNASNTTGFVTYSDCPFDYCSSSPVTLNFSATNGADAQCAFNRSGKLCGSCKNGTSLVFGSSHCMPCSNSWIALIIPFALAGLVLVIFILVCNLTVAVGTINGLVFYANIIVANSAIFLPFDKPNLLTVFLAWINLDLGIQTCFYDGMDAYVKTLLQIAFPLYIFLLVVVILILGKYWELFAHLLRHAGSDPVATLATLILLSYAKLVRTIIAALSPATLLYPDGTQHTVWLIDGDIDYFKGKHIPLVVTIISIVLIGMLYTLLLCFWQLIVHCLNFKPMKWLKINGKIEIFIRTYHGQFNAKHRYWVGLLLLTRIMLSSVSALSSDPSVILLTITIICIVFLCVRTLWGGQIYNDWPLNVLENVFLLNLGVFSAATLFTRATQQTQEAVAYTSTGIAILLFMMILLYHLTNFILKKMCKPICKTTSKVDSSDPEDFINDQDIDIPYDKQSSTSVINIHGLLCGDSSLHKVMLLESDEHSSYYQESTT